MRDGARFLAVDFGTTSTKSALVDLDTGRFSHLRRRDALPTVRPGPGRHEVSLEAIRSRFDELCAEAWRVRPFAGIVVCSEMHGAALLDADSGARLTDYVSWLDGRALEPGPDGTSAVERVRARLGDDGFRRRTGMRPRPGFPLLNLLRCADLLDGPRRALALSLPGWLAFDASAAPAAPPEHPTILAGMALYDVVAGALDSGLLDLLDELGGLRLVPGEPAAEGTVAGYWSGPDGDVPLYVGVGDHQCSVLGAGVVAPGTASVNLGTGSQVGLVDGPLDDVELVEHRPFFDGEHLAAVTHIPAGRALNEFIGFLQRLDAGTDWWARLAALGPAEVEAASLSVNLAVFDGARGFAGGGQLGGILEGGLTPDNYLASVLGAFARQYAEVLERLDPDGAVTRVILSGGIARNLPQLAAVEADMCRRPVDGAVPLDESLLGLRAVALRCAGRTATVAEAQGRFGRACELEEDR